MDKLKLTLALYAMMTACFMTHAQKPSNLRVLVSNPNPDYTISSQFFTFDGTYFREDVYIRTFKDSHVWIIEEKEDNTVVKYGATPDDACITLNREYALTDSPDAVPFTFGEEFTEDDYLCFWMNWEEKEIVFSWDKKCLSTVTADPPEGNIPADTKEIRLTFDYDLYWNSFNPLMVIPHLEGGLTGGSCQNHEKYLIYEVLPDHSGVVSVELPCGYYVNSKLETIDISNKEAKNGYVNFRWKFTNQAGVEAPLLDDAPQTGIYDMLGRRLGTAESRDALPAGLYIIDGKKVMINR